MISDIENLLKRGNWQEARKLAQGFLSQQPNAAKVHAYLGLTYMYEADYERAVKPLKVAVTLDPKLWRAGTWLAQSLDHLQRYEEALEAVEIALRVKPSDPTLNHLKSGLQRNVPERITDAWEKSVHLDWYNVELTHQD
jgi:tetratricopeptide (TPR) repeat protein